MRLAVAAQACVDYYFSERNDALGEVPTELMEELQEALNEKKLEHLATSTRSLTDKQCDLLRELAQSDDLIWLGIHPNEKRTAASLKNRGLIEFHTFEARLTAAGRNAIKMLPIELPYTSPDSK